MTDMISSSSNKLSLGWGLALLANGLVWLFIGIKSGDLARQILGAGMLIAAIAAFRIKVLSATPAANMLFYAGSLLMLAAAAVSLAR